MSTGCNMFDMVNNTLMRELERLDEVDPKSDEGKAEVERAKAVHLISTAAISNASTTVTAMNAVCRVTGKLMSERDVPRLLGGGGDA